MAAARVGRHHCGALGAEGGITQLPGPCLRGPAGRHLAPLPLSLWSSKGGSNCDGGSIFCYGFPECKPVPGEELRCRMRKATDHSGTAGVFWPVLGSRASLHSLPQLCLSLSGPPLLGSGLHFLTV